jgi:hypothetical protein
MAVKLCFWLVPPTAAVPQIAVSGPGEIFKPQIMAVFKGVSRQTAGTFMERWSIVFISDDRWFFMSFASYFMTFPFY